MKKRVKKMNEVLILAIIWMNIENAMLNKNKPHTKDKYYLIPHNSNIVTAQ